MHFSKQNSVNFYINTKKVNEALEWLTLNNILYQDDLTIQQVNETEIVNVNILEIDEYQLVEGKTYCKLSSKLLSSKSDIFTAADEFLKYELLYISTYLIHSEIRN